MPLLPTDAYGSAGGPDGPLLTVVTVTHNSSEELALLVRSLRRNLPEGVQLVVVDSASSDGTACRARELGADVVALERNEGFGAANNRGVRLASAPVTALLNPDVELLDDGLLDLVRRAAGRRRALFAPRLIGADGRVQRSAHPRPGGAEALLFAALGPALPRPLLLRAEPWRSTTTTEVGWAVGAAIVARTDLLRGLGPFDPRPFLYAEDLDLCLRAAEIGAPTIYEPSVVIRHREAHATRVAFAGEPFELLAARRREVVADRLGRRALALDDAAQALTFSTRAAARLLAGRPPDRPLSQLAALRVVRRRRAGHRSGRR